MSKADWSFSSSDTSVSRETVFSEDRVSPSLSSLPSLYSRVSAFKPKKIKRTVSWPTSKHVGVQRQMGRLNFQ